MVHIEFDVFALVVDANECINAAAFESAGDLLPDHVLEILILAWKFDVNVQVAVVHAFDFDEHRQIRRFRARGSEPGHAVDHGLTS